MARAETGWGSWLVFISLLVISSVVLGIEWNKECDGGLRRWLLTAVCVTAVCGILGAAFHGKGDSTRPSRFLDDDDDDDDRPVPVMAMDLDPMDGAANVHARPAGGALTLPTLREEGGISPMPGGSVASEIPDYSVENSVTSRRESSISGQLASRVASSLQLQYFGTGPKVFPDAIFLVLVLSQWFMAAWSIVGAILYLRLFEAGRTCSPLLRHWTLLVVIVGFLSCLLAVCYSGIMCCMMGGPFENDRYMDSDRDRFEGDVASNSDASTAVKGGVGMM